MLFQSIAEGHLLLEFICIDLDRFHSYTAITKNSDVKNLGQGRFVHSQ